MISQMEKKTVAKSEAGKQFEEIYEKHHLPESREKRKILKNREERIKQNKEDIGV